MPPNKTWGRRMFVCLLCDIYLRDNETLPRRRGPARSAISLRILSPKCLLVAEPVSTAVRARGGSFYSRSILGPCCCLSLCLVSDAWSFEQGPAARAPACRARGAALARATRPAPFTVSACTRPSRNRGK